MAVDLTVDPTHEPYPDSFFSVGWRFEPDPARPAQAPPPLLGDLRAILAITARHELLIPSQVQDRGRRIALQADSAEEFIDRLSALLETGELGPYLDEIAGHGRVERPDGTRVRQDGLIFLQDLRLHERTYSVGTRKSLWTPIALDRSFGFEWQVELADRNGPRLERCLREIDAALGLAVDPPAHELDREQPMWIHGFKLFTSPQILRSEFAADPPPGLASIERFIAPGWSMA
ncbi:hypothetical protein SAMN02745121_02846 [Nannocystis exedens]|uniref:Uncharacterized protein n=1 Tax=Nannocystis exedens TaxID=54 RepID=A0A1I1XGH5_9BACT|nr:hypothetical protein [Nannocystis exedens]PCC73425.1 hypothetical protein NAEX_06513 [Nannocystis exedens]SFE06447.1 hypothetical protein SAMN02745121_02846 [Nannocystis exedens]